METTSRSNLRRLRRLVRREGALLPALRIYTGESTQAMCRRLGLSRTSVQIMGVRKWGRREDTTRRALELALELPTYSLDQFLDKEA